MSTRDVGDQVTLDHRVRNADGTLTAATAVLTVTDPAGSTTTPTVSNPSTGLYRAAFTLTSAGTWSWVWTISGAVVDVETGQVLAATTPTPAPYSTIDVLKLAVGMPLSDGTRDALLNLALVGASRGVEKYCDGREPGGFYLDTTATARVFDIRGAVRCDSYWGEWIKVDDIGSVSGLIVEISSDNTIWSTLTGIETGPDNALVRGRAIDTLFSPTFQFSYRRLARVTARWGWPAVPDEVEQATLLQASRLYRRKDSPEGVAGSADWGLVRVPNLDPDVKALLADFKSLMVA